MNKGTAELSILLLTLINNYRAPALIHFIFGRFNWV